MAFLRFGSRSLLFKLAALLSLIAVPLAQADDPAGTLAFTLDVPAALSRQDVSRAALQTAIKRGWTVKSENDRRIVLYLHHRRHEATVTYLIANRELKAYCEGYITDRAGQRVRPEQPAGWLRNLQKDLSAALQRAAYVDKK